MVLGLWQVSDGGSKPDEAALDLMESPIGHGELPGSHTSPVSSVHTFRHSPNINLKSPSVSCDSAGT